MASKLEQLGLTAPFKYNADGSVNGQYKIGDTFYEYHIHQTATPDQWAALQEDITSSAITIAPYVAPVIDPAIIAAALKRSARFALSASDTTIIRCTEAGVAIPQEWKDYRNALRAIISGADTTSTALPNRPAYPAGS